QFDGEAVFAVVVMLLLLLVLVVAKMVSGKMWQQRHSLTLIVVVALGNVYKVVVAVVEKGRGLVNNLMGRLCLLWW
nr:hypothetical protein [Tanacetum cinerariifolium]